MKKLPKLVLNKAVKMTAPQMKYITGGYGSGYGSNTCGFAIQVLESYEDPSLGLFWWIDCGVSRHNAESMMRVADGDGHWCCDSCSTTWFCGNGH